MNKYALPVFSFLLFGLLLLSPHIAKLSVLGEELSYHRLDYVPLLLDETIEAAAPAVELSVSQNEPRSRAPEIREEKPAFSADSEVEEVTSDTVVEEEGLAQEVFVETTIVPNSTEHEIVIVDEEKTEKNVDEDVREDDEATSEGDVLGDSVAVGDERPDRAEKQNPTSTDDGKGSISRDRELVVDTGNGNGSQDRRSPAPFVVMSVYKFLNGSQATAQTASDDAFPIVVETASSSGLTSLNPENDYRSTYAVSSFGLFSVQEVMNDRKSESPVFDSQSACTQFECRSDLDHDGTVGASDLAILYGDWSFIPPTSDTILLADIDGSGMTDASDLGILLGDWGPCQASYKIDGYSFGSSLEEAVNATTSAEAPTFTGQLQNQSVIIWNSLCEFNDEEDGDGDGNGDGDTDPDPEDTDGGGSSGSSSGGQSGSRIKNNGDVLGAFTEAGDVLGASTCSEEYLSSYIKYGAQNDPVEVTKLQAFLNKYINAGLALNGFYGDETRSAVNAFQRTQSAFVLQPWVDAGLMENIDTPTGYVYKTTRRWINILECPSLMPVLPVPQLP